MKTRSSPIPPASRVADSGAVDRDRTGDLFLTKEVLYQLSYNGPRSTRKRLSPGLRRRAQNWWTGKDSNLRTPQGRTDLQSVGFNHSPTCPIHLPCYPSLPYCGFCALRLGSILWLSAPDSRSISQTTSLPSGKQRLEPRGISRWPSAVGGNRFVSPQPPWESIRVGTLNARNA